MQLGVDALAAAVATHDEADHVGGLEQLLGRFPVDRLALRARGRRLLSGERRRRRDAGPGGGGQRALGRAAAGSSLAAAGAARLPLDGADPNSRSLVIDVRWRHFTMLLTADAEAEAVPLDPGPIDVLKVAHHGSEDAGLGGAARPHQAEARGDLGRRGQPLRPSGGVDSCRPWPPTASGSCEPTGRATSLSPLAGSAIRSWVDEAVRLDE